MKRIICIALCTIAVPTLVPALADAKITPQKSPKAVACGTTLKLGATARHHSGSRRVKIRIHSGKQLVFKRTIRATKHFKKSLPCGKRYRIVYRMPSGRKVTRKIKVRRGAGPNGQGLPPSPALPIVNSGSDNESTPTEQQEQAEEAAEEACDILNEQHEDDPDWDPFACMGPDDDSTDPDENDEDDEGDE